ncbi:MAG: hypothetical protein AW08_00343 [Candidatus Accumulibacter adjunctus]|uniref:Lysine-specific metallo-endopeptidase domain-containing protein n=1 Tax=Candidatus Accumulibacter adjunctus TaxID=1454001 RepID=A0A011NYZ7_9PROT|nr:MAG: hypothetical protein AW08_00343 [Candidatus Accumulibacter adjunctus]
MNVFTEVYNKSIELLRSPSLHEDWKTIEANLKALLQPEGPEMDRAKVLEDLRDKLRKAADKSGGVREKAKATELVRIARTDKEGFQARAALLKQFKHFYMVAKKGSQSVWVVDQPKSYGKWNYDLFDGQTPAQVTDLLAKSAEVFGAGNRQMMSDSLQQARKWSADTETRLADPNTATLASVRRWFHTEAATERDVKATCQTLLDGFKKITAATNSGRVIFSDRPHYRASGDYNNTYASVNALDRMPVIYIYPLFLNTGKRNKLTGRIPTMWLCALTVVHELSHKVVNTEDVRYDSDGLKPSDLFPADKAIKNADSWAYFCADLLGYVPKAAIEDALQ